MLFLFSELMAFAAQLSRRYIKEVGAFCFAVLAFLIGFTNATHNVDYPTYRMFFDSMPKLSKSQWHFEKGYSYLSVWCARAGLNYRMFRILICCAAIVILYLGVRRFTKNTALFAGIYAGTVFLLDATQVRNFLMISIVVYALSFLQIKSWQHYLIAVVLILISAQFHSLGYMFLLVVVVQALPFDLVRRLSLWVVGFAVIVVGLINVIGVHNILSLMARVVGVLINRPGIVQKVSTQYGDGSALIRYVMVAVAAIAAFLLVWFLERIVQTSHDGVAIAKFQVLYSAVLVSVVLLPALSLADDYSRIPRSLFLMVILAICIYYDLGTHVQISRMRSLVSALVVAVCVINSVSYLYTGGTAFRGSLMYLIQLK